MPLVSASLTVIVSLARTFCNPAASLVIRKPAKSLSITVTWAAGKDGRERVSPLNTVPVDEVAGREAFTAVAVVERVTSLATLRLVPFENCNVSPAFKFRVRDVSVSLSLRPTVPLSWLKADAGMT